MIKLPFSWVLILTVVSKLSFWTELLKAIVDSYKAELSLMFCPFHIPKFPFAFFHELNQHEALTRNGTDAGTMLLDS